MDKEEAVKSIKEVMAFIKENNEWDIIQDAIKPHLRSCWVDDYDRMVK